MEARQFMRLIFMGHIPKQKDRGRARKTPAALWPAPCFLLPPCGHHAENLMQHDAFSDYLRAFYSFSPDKSQKIHKERGFMAFLQAARQCGWFFNRNIPEFSEGAGIIRLRLLQRTEKACGRLAKHGYCQAFISKRRVLVMLARLRTLSLISFGSAAGAYLKVLLSGIYFQAPI